MTNLKSKISAMSKAVLPTLPSLWRRRQPVQQTEPELNIEELHVQNGRVNAIYSGPAAQDFAETLASAFYHMNGKNYVEVHLRDNEGAKFMLTFQKVSGKTPHQCRVDAEKQRDVLVGQLADLFQWQDRSYVHATMHIENAVNNLRADAGCTCAEVEGMALYSPTCRNSYHRERSVRNHPPTDECPEAECVVCSVRDCPDGEPLHYHHDGCPVCSI